jgi:hypothetical protein
MFDEVAMFRTEDGKLHASKIDAMAHAQRDRFLERANRYIQSRTWNRGRDTVALNVLLGFLAFEELNSELVPE